MSLTRQKKSKGQQVNTRKITTQRREKTQKKKDYGEENRVRGEIAPEKKMKNFSERGTEKNTFKTIKQKLERGLVKRGLGGKRKKKKGLLGGKEGFQVGGWSLAYFWGRYSHGEELKWGRRREVNVLSRVRKRKRLGCLRGVARGKGSLPRTCRKRKAQTNFGGKVWEREKSSI